jgi:hypothetical protein
MGFVDVTEVGSHPAVAAEALIERAVAMVADDAEIKARPACGHDLAVGLKRNPIGQVDATTEVGSHPAVAAEALVERAVAIVAGEGEVELADHAAARVPRGHDLAVGL